MKYVFIFLVGFGTHKALQTVYSYIFWSTEYSCAAKAKTSAETAICANSKLKVPNLMAKILLVHVSYTMGHWGLEY
jgi:hypothetical protein